MVSSSACSFPRSRARLPLTLADSLWAQVDLARQVSSVNAERRGGRFFRVPVKMGHDPTHPSPISGLSGEGNWLISEKQPKRVAADVILSV